MELDKRALDHIFELLEETDVVREMGHEEKIDFYDMIIDCIQLYANAVSEISLADNNGCGKVQ